MMREMRPVEWMVRFVRNPWTSLVTAILVASSGAYDLAVTLPMKLESGKPQDLAGEGLIALWGVLLILSAVKDVLGGFMRLDHAIEKLEDEGRLVSWLRRLDAYEQTWWWNLAFASLYLVCGVFELYESFRDLSEGFEMWFVGLLTMGSWIALRSVCELAHVLEFMRKAGMAKAHPRLAKLREWMDKPAVGMTLCVLVMAVGLVDVVFLEKAGHSAGAQYGMILAVFARLVRGGKVLGHAGNVLGSART